MAHKLNLTLGLGNYTHECRPRGLACEPTSKLSCLFFLHPGEGSAPHSPSNRPSSCSRWSTLCMQLRWHPSASPTVSGRCLFKTQGHTCGRGTSDLCRMLHGDQILPQSIPLTTGLAYTHWLLAMLMLPLPLTLGCPWTCDFLCCTGPSSHPPLHGAWYQVPALAPTSSQGICPGAWAVTFQDNLTLV